MHEDHRKFFNRLAPEWNVMSEFDPAVRDHLLRFYIRPGDRVLDLGAGTGRTSALLAELAGPDGLTIATDFSEAMLAEAENDGFSPVTADVHTLPFGDDSFNKVLCFSAFPHFRDQLASLVEMRRVLKPGGRALILHVVSSTKMNAFHAGLEGCVRHDRLPDLETLGRMFTQAELSTVVLEEADNLYWAEARKV